MADLYGVASSPSVTLSAGIARTCVQIFSPANIRTRVLGIGVFFDGVSATAAPVRVRLVRQTSAGTMTLLTPLKTTTRAETLLVTAQHSATVEPTLGDVIDDFRVHPQQGYEVRYPQGQEPVIGGGGWIGIECNAPATVSVVAKIFFEE